MSFENHTKYLLQTQDQDHSTRWFDDSCTNIEEIIPIVRKAKDAQTAKDGLINLSMECEFS